MANFTGMPSRGGKLTILNCLLWAVVAIGIANDDPVLMLPALVVCWPIAWLSMPPVQGGLSPLKETAVIAALMIGANSLIWGYGISWVLSLIEQHKRRRTGPESAMRGFQVVAPHEPELPADASSGMAAKN